MIITLLRKLLRIRGRFQSTWAYYIIHAMSKLSFTGFWVLPSLLMNTFSLWKGQQFLSCFIELTTSIEDLFRTTNRHYLPSLVILADNSDITSPSLATMLRGSKIWEVAHWSSLSSHSLYHHSQWLELSWPVLFDSWPSQASYLSYSIV